MEKIYYQIEQNTGIASQLAVNALMRGGVAHVPANSLRVAPLAIKDGFAVVAKADLSGTEYVEDNRGKNIYSTADAAVSNVVSALGEIEVGYTLDKPPAFAAWENGGWVQQLAPIKKAKKAAVSAWRNAQEGASDTTVIINGIEWDADPNSRTRINGVLLASDVPAYWTDANNADQPITREVLQLMSDEITSLGFLVHERQRTMKADIEDLRTVAAVEAYVIGWSV